MTDKAIIEAATRAIDYRITLPNSKTNELARAVIDAVTPLIRAAALEEAAKVADGQYYAPHDDASGAIEQIATDIRALKEQP